MNVASINTPLRLGVLSAVVGSGNDKGGEVGAGRLTDRQAGERTARPAQAQAGGGPASCGGVSFHRQVDLRRRSVRCGWCAPLPLLLHAPPHRADLGGAPLHHTRETLPYSLSTSGPPCYTAGLSAASGLLPARRACFLSLSLPVFLSIHPSPSLSRTLSPSSSPVRKV